MKLWIASMLPICDRFSSWFNYEFKRVAEDLGVDVEVIGIERKCVDVMTNYFTNEYEAVEHEAEQLKVLNVVARRGDKVLWLDLDYPGFSVPMAFLLKLRGVKNYGIFHGAYFNKGDVWSPLPERRWFMMSAIRVCEKVFVGSKYFKDMIVKHLDVDESKIVVTGLPFYPDRYDFNPSEKKDIVVVVGDVGDIKVPGYEVVVGRGMKYSKFIDLLRKAKYMIAFKDAETFGYAVLEAMASGVIVLVPPSFSYPEFYAEGGLMVFAKCIHDAIEFIEKNVWSPKDVEDRYRKSIKIISWYRNSARRIVEEVILGD